MAGLTAYQQLPALNFAQISGASKLRQDTFQAQRDRRTADFLRLHDTPNQFLQLALGASTQPTLDNFFQPDNNGAMAGLGMASTLAGAYMGYQGDVAIANALA
jgi:hypothetical protein